MYYNYIRFGSVFDFGASYNLTTNDMTNRGFVLARIPMSIWMYFFQPAHIVTVFPFFYAVSFHSGFLIRTIREATYGGVFNNVILLLNFFIYRYRKELKERKLLGFVLLSVLFAFFVGIFDAQYAGILQRYFADFSWFLFIPSTIMALLIYKLLDGKRRKEFCMFIFICFCLSISYNLLSVADVYWRYNLDIEPSIYSRFASVAEFWL